VSSERGCCRRFWELLGSLGLCCVLLLCLFVLTVQGTLYQVDHGLFAAKERFFASWFIWVDVGGVGLPVFPGGITCMGLTAINLIVGGILRLRWGWRVIGVFITHLGVVFMLVAGLVTHYFASEGQLKLHEGEQADYFIDAQRWEVAIWDTGLTGDGTEHVIEQELFEDLLGEGERTYTSDDLPFDLVLSGYVPNCNALPKGPMWEAAGPVIDGYGLQALAVDTEIERNFAGIHARANGTGEAEVQGLLWGGTLLPWTVEAGGRTWAVKLRHARHAMPFTIRLDEFQMEEYPGTGMAKAYRSYVTRLDGELSERSLIEMNEPLREGGLVFFQSSWGPARGPAGPYSVLSVVRNPSDIWPEIAMWVILLGMLLAFGVRLGRYVVWLSRQLVVSKGGVS